MSVTNAKSGADVSAPRVKRVGMTLVGQAQYTSVQAAITAAAAMVPAPDASNPAVVEIYPGVYNEAITMAASVNLKGIGPKGAVVIYQVDATIVTLANPCQIENLTVTLVTPSAIRNLIIDNGVACVCRFVNVLLTVTTPSTFSGVLWKFTGAGTYFLTSCSYSITGGSGGFVGIQNTTNAATIRLLACDFQNDDITAFTMSLGAAGIATCIDSVLLAGKLTASVGIIRLRNCTYRQTNRSSTGNIVDESPYPASYGFHVEKIFWQNALLATMNLAIRTALAGTVTPGGLGQAVLTINDNVLDGAGVESAADVAGALASTFTPARTPRYSQQISVSAFRATTTMFFGLRATLGAAVPGMAEHHAGFIWTGAAFNASSSNGGGVGGTTALTTPSTGVQHQLEVIIIGGVQVEFYVDGVLVATHTTAAKIPTVALYFQEYEISSGAGGATTSDITLREGFIQECPA